MLYKSGSVPFYQGLRWSPWRCLYMGYTHVLELTLLGWYCWVAAAPCPHTLCQTESSVPLPPFLPPLVALPTSCQWKRGAAAADLGCRIDESHQTATVFTTVGLEAAGVVNVLEDSWLAHAPRLLCHCHLNGASYFFSTQSRMSAHSLLRSVPCCSFMGGTVPGVKWLNTVTTR